MINRILFFLTALIFSSSAYADTYWFKGNKVKDKNGTEYLIFTDEHKVQLGFKVDGLNLVPIKDSKTDSIAKQKKIDEEVEKEKEKTINIQNFVNNLLKLSFTLLGMIIIFFIVSVLCGIIWIIVGISTIFKKS
jgi:UV DNA damage repair endonuclease